MKIQINTSIDQIQPLGETFNIVTREGAFRIKNEGTAADLRAKDGIAFVVDIDVAKETLTIPAQTADVYRDMQKYTTVSVLPTKLKA